MSDYHPKPRHEQRKANIEETTPWTSRMFGTACAVDHETGKMSDQRIAQMTESELRSLAFSGNSIRSERYWEISAGGAKYEKHAAHRAYFALGILTGSIRHDCPYQRQVDAMKK